MSAPNGDMRPDSPDGHGLWLGDMRHLSEWNRSEVRGLHFAGRRIDLTADGRRVKLGALPPGVTILS